MPKVINLIIGEKYGDWTVISPSQKRNSKGSKYYKCKCKCGFESEIQSNALKNGMSTGCRKCGFKKSSLKLKGRISPTILPEGESQRNALYSRYKQKARERNIIFNLSKELFNEITKRSCYYCGKQPSQISRGAYAHGNYIYNGIDRLDNNKGYEIDNIVSCCKFCNRAKDTLSTKEFIENIERIYKHCKEDKK